jgi:ubiquinone/menaquinone biosynthesis C-methylase UbiE
MEDVRRDFIPAAGRDWRLRLYDPLTRLIGADRARRTLVEGAALRLGQQVLEVGCGTGSLLVEIGRRQPGVELVGLDPDASALDRARRKADRAGVTIELDRGFADALPYPDAAFDRVLSSFMFHHLQGGEKASMLGEVRRVLKSGGSFYLLDFVGPGAGAHGLSGWVRSRPLLRDNAEDRIVALVTKAGLEGPRKIGEGSLVFGLLAYACFEARSLEPQTARSVPGGRALID